MTRSATNHNLIAALLGLLLLGQAQAQLQFGFYKGKCKATDVDVESTVRRIVSEKYQSDKSIVAALLRGYEIIDTVKTTLEGSCGPQVVSCADIIVMATRDAVSFAKGGFYNVQTGRRDGLASSAQSVSLPVTKIFVVGGHTVGVASCAFFQDHNSYYQQLLRRNGVLQVDQDLASHPLTGFIVSGIANRADFSARFGQAMVNLGAVDVLTGQQGQIRKSCRVVNK
ncbi:Peroxidase 44 [Linum perenne]